MSRRHRANPRWNGPIFRHARCGARYEAPEAAQCEPQGVDEGANAALEAARRPDAEQLPHEQPEIQAADLQEQALEDVAVSAALLRGSKTDPQRLLPTDPLTTDSVRRRPTKLSHLIEDVTCEDGLRLLPRPTARSKALPDDQLVPVGGELLLSPQSVEIIKFGDPGSGR